MKRQYARVSGGEYSAKCKCKWLHYFMHNCCCLCRYKATLGVVVVAEFSVLSTWLVDYLLRYAFSPVERMASFCRYYDYRYTGHLYRLHKKSLRIDKYVYQSSRMQNYSTKPIAFPCINNKHAEQ